MHIAFFERMTKIHYIIELAFVKVLDILISYRFGTPSSPDKEEYPHMAYFIYISYKLNNSARSTIKKWGSPNRATKDVAICVLFLN